MSVALSSGGGGAGLGMAAQAYQAPPSMPSGPTHTDTGASSYMRSNNVTTLDEPAKASPLELAKSVAPLLSISFSTKTLSYSSASSTLGQGIASNKIPTLTLSVPDTEGARKALKKFIKKSDCIGNAHANGIVVTKSDAKSDSKSDSKSDTTVPAGNIPLPTDIYKHILTTSAATSFYTLEFTTQNKLLLPYSHMLALYTYSIYLALPPSVSSVSPFLSLPLPASTPENVRGIAHAALACIDNCFKPTGAPTKKKSAKGAADNKIHSTPPNSICAVLASLHRATPDAVKHVSTEINRTLVNAKAQRVSLPGVCVRECDQPLILHVSRVSGVSGVSGVDGGDSPGSQPGYDMCIIACETGIGSDKAVMFQKYSVISRVTFVEKECDVSEGLKGLVDNVKRQRVHGSLVMIVASDKIKLTPKEIEALDPLTEHSVGAAQQPLKPIVVQAGSDTVSVGSVILLSSGGTGRCELPNKSCIQVRDVLSNTIALKLVLNGVVSYKNIFDFNRSLPAKYEWEISAADVVGFVNDNANVYSDDLDDDVVESYKGKKFIPQRESGASNLKVFVVERIGCDGKFVECPRTGGSSNEVVQFEPLLFEDRDGRKVASDECRVTFTVDTAGCAAFDVSKDLVPISIRHERTSSDKWFWWKIIAVLVLIFGAISYRTYTVTHVFSYNTRKLHRYYQFEVKKKINSIQEARYIVYTYQDKEDKLWEKLERKYGIPVLEPSAYDHLIDAEEEAAYENAKDMPEEGQTDWSTSEDVKFEEEGKEEGKEEEKETEKEKEKEGTASENKKEETEGENDEKTEEEEEAKKSKKTSEDEEL
jgi:hypothetical protein